MFLTNTDFDFASSRILLVDDDTANLRLLQALLSREGYTNLVSVQDSRNVFERYKEEPTDLILLDLSMPNIDGYTVMERLNALEDPLLCPIIVLTSHTAKDFLVNALAAGARDYITKPFNPRELAARVRNMLEISLAQRKLYQQKELLDGMVQERTRELKENFELFFDLNPNYCYRLSPEGIIIDVNQSALQVLKYSKEEIIGKPINMIYSEDSRERARELFGKLTTVGNLKGEEINIVSKDGDSWPVLLNCACMKNQAGNIRAILSIQQDVSELKKREADLVKKETMLKRTQAIAHLGTWEYDAQEGSLTWSDETYRIFGKDPGEFDLTFENFLQCLYPDDLKAVSEAFENSIEQGLMGYEIFHRIIHGVTGTIRWVYERSFHTRDANDNFIRSIGIVLDITERQKLTLEYEKYFQAIKSLHNTVIFTDVDGNITHANPSFTRLYGFTEDEVIGKNPRILNPGRDIYYDYGYSNAEVTAIFSSLWKSITDPDIGTWEGEILNRTKTGEILRVHLYINAIRDKESNIISFVALPIDVSSEHAREQDVRVQNYMAIAKLAAKRDNETGQHMKRIGKYSQLIASKLQLSRKFCEDIRLFAPLHDIGKVGINDNILLAPRKLTEDEFETMKTHVMIGWDILKERSALEMAAEIAYGHHEKYDGSGYPQGLSGGSIPLAARITAVADIYDALRSERPYKQPFSEEKSFTIITDLKGTHLDPDLVDVFIKCREDFDNIFTTLSD